MEYSILERSRMEIWFAENAFRGVEMSDVYDKDDKLKWASGRV